MQGRLAVAPREWRQQIRDNRIVVARVERDVAAAAVGQGRHDIERAIAIEGGNLDRDDAIDLEKAAPERPIQDAAAHGGLQVEPDERDDLRHTPAVIEHALIIGLAQGGETQKRGMIPERCCQLCFPQRLVRGTADPSNGDGTIPAIAAPVPHRPVCQSQHGLEKADTGVADRELRGVDADGDAAGPGVAVITRKGHLAPLIESPCFGQRERMRRNHQPSKKRVPERREVARIRSRHLAPRSGSAC